MKQLSIVSYYGEKPNEFAELIGEVQRVISMKLSNAFVSYSLGQIHGTIVSLERLDNSGFINKNFAQLRNMYLEMDYEGLLNYFKGTKPFQLEIQIGRFEPGSYGFQSRGKDAYTRSFSIQGSLANVIGWPTLGAKSSSNFRLSTVLGKIRKDVEQFNVLHSYHLSDTDLDNDFYFRVGIVDANSVDLSQRVEVEEDVRKLLSKHIPVMLTLKPENIFVAFYIDQRLPLSSTLAWSLSDPAVDSDFIRKQYLAP